MKRKIAAVFADWMRPIAVALVCLTAVGVGGFLYFTRMELRHASRESAASNKETLVSSASPVAGPSAVASSPPPAPSNERFSAELVPFVTDKTRIILANEYVAAAEPKAFALNQNGIIGLSSSAPNEEGAKSAALELCQKRADSVKSPR